MQKKAEEALVHPERTFFALRYSAPGITFILFAVLVSYPTLKDVVFTTNVPLVAAFLAFFSVLGGGGIGFLVSQVWYFLTFRFGYGDSGKLKKLRQDIKEEYHLRENRYNQLLFLDYMARLLPGVEMKECSKRRFDCYDLMHTCGSTLVATILGSFIGFLIRIGAFSFHFSVEQALGLLWRGYTLDLWSLSKGIFVYDITTGVTILLLLAVLWKGLKHVSEEYARIMDFQVRAVQKLGKFSHEEAQGIFPSEYFCEDSE